MKPVLDVLRRPRIILALAGTSALLALNWLVFLWAVEQHQVVQVSLGYFINPLLNVALGALLLRERLNRAQGIAVALAAASVLFLAISAGEMPRVALLLAGSFGLYGLFRKQLPIDPLTGLLVETALLWPLAVAGLVAVGLRGDGALGRHGLTTDALMLLAGAWTAVPLLCFVAAARRLTLTTLGFFQYIAPSLQFLTAVVLWDEPFDATRLLAFGGIWLGLAIVSADALLRSRRERPAPG